jgi:hypothetical protein
MSRSGARDRTEAWLNEAADRGLGLWGLSNSGARGGLVEAARLYGETTDREPIGAGRAMPMTISPAIVRRSRVVIVVILAAMTAAGQQWSAGGNAHCRRKR